MSIADKLITIADNTPLVAAAVNAKKPGKNKIPFPYIFASGTTYHGITATYNEDGVVLLNGTATASLDSVTDFVLCEISDLPAGRYTLSGCPAGGATYTYRLFIIRYKANGTVEYTNDIGAGTAFTIDNGDRIRLTIRIGRDLGFVENLTFYPQIEAGTVATAYEPYKDPVLYAQALEKAQAIKEEMEKLKEEISYV